MSVILLQTFHSYLLKKFLEGGSSSKCVIVISANMDYKNRGWTLLTKENLLLEPLGRRTTIHKSFWHMHQITLLIKYICRMMSATYYLKCFIQSGFTLTSFLKSVQMEATSEIHFLRTVFIFWRGDVNDKPKSEDASVYFAFTGCNGIISQFPVSSWKHLLSGKDFGQKTFLGLSIEKANSFWLCPKECFWM